jgi:CheY-like chemotaxis protein
VDSEPNDAKDHITLVLKVQDTGHGMTETELDILFEEYTRFSERKSNAIEGTGLGLAITQRLVYLMNGRISVESESGIGSIFTIKLPQQVKDKEIMGFDVTQNLKKFHRNYVINKRVGQIKRDPMPYGKVLVVDDMETNHYVAIGLMKLYKLNIETTLSGKEAIKKIESGNVYDVVFMDHMMPEMNGIEATAKLRELNYKEPIVALTANAVAGQAEMFMQNGFDDFISKPIDIRQLNTILNKFIKDKQPKEVIEEARKRFADSNTKLDKDRDSKIDTMLLDSFIRDTCRAVSTLEELLKKDNLTDEESLRSYTITVHGIKSSLLNVNELELSEWAANLEKGARDIVADVSDFQVDLVPLRDQTPDFVVALKNLIKKYEKAPDNVSSENENIEDTKERLSEIVEMCDDLDRKGILDTILKLTNISKKTKEVLELIKENILHSDFDEAKALATDYFDVLSHPSEEVDINSVIEAQLKNHPITGLDVQRGLVRNDNNYDRYFRILRSYVSSVQSMMDTVESVDKDSIKAYKIKVHGIKGASLDIFADQIGTSAAILERAAEADDLEYILENNPAFIELVKQMIFEFDIVLKAIKNNSNKQKKDKPDKDLLTKLFASCKKYDIDGADNAMALLEKYHYESDDGLVDWLRHNVDLMNFRQIVERLTDNI